MKHFSCTHTHTRTRYLKSNNKRGTILLRRVCECVAKPFRHMKAAATNDKDTPFLPHKGAFHGSHSGADSSDTHTNTRRHYTERKEMNTCQNYRFLCQEESPLQLLLNSRKNLILILYLNIIQSCNFSI